MSLVFAGVEVAGGATVGLKDRVNLNHPVYLQQQQRGDRSTSSSKGEEEEEDERNGFFLAEKVEEEESSETSSIGAQSSDSSSEKDGEEEEEEEVQSKAKDGALASLDSLQESLPIKRGLSNFFSGKSKSFASLADVATAASRDLAKPENPFNKRRRLLMASKPRRASYASLVTSLPPLHIAEEKEEEEEEEEEGGGGDQSNGGETSALAPLPPHGTKERKIIKKAFRSPRSFSLSDLQNV